MSFNVSASTLKKEKYKRKESRVDTKNTSQKSNSFSIEIV